MSNMSRQGYFGTASYDRYAAHNEQSTVHKLRETYWTTKQAVYKKLGKNQDEHVIASDAQLDAKLEVFKAIQKSCMDLLRAIEMYQDRLCALSQEENAMGRFLKAESQVDKTRAGKIMAAVGKAQSFSSQQRLALRVPLVRLYQEVETFRYRAISDTLMTINRMETARTEYRASLMWMQDVSKNLDPDTYKQLEKFRKVQAQVKKTKAKFDRLKLDSMQKIDLLAASRCNMFSHVLANYQNTLLHFWSKTSRTMTAVAESFKGYQYYEFNMLKELAETSKKLAEETGGKDVTERDIDGLSRDGSDIDEEGEEVDEADSHDEERNDRLVEGMDDISHPAHLGGSQNNEDNQGLFDRLINFDEDQQQNGASGSMTNLLQAVDNEIEKGAKREGADDPFMDFQDEDNEQTIDDIKQKQDAEFDITAKLFTAAEEKKKQEKKQKGHAPKDLLSDELDDDMDKDDMALLNEILNTPSTTEDSGFSKEWQAVFGPSPMSNNSNLTPGETDQLPQQGSEFLPSNLLDITQQMGAMSMPGMPQQMMGGMPGGMMPQQMSGGMGMAGMMGSAQPSPFPAGASQQPGMPANQQAPPPTQPGGKPSSKKQKADMSAWFNLFADLDPLADPDAIGKRPEETQGYL